MKRLSYQALAVTVTVCCNSYCQWQAMYGKTAASFSGVRLHCAVFDPIVMCPFPDQGRDWFWILDTCHLSYGVKLQKSILGSVDL